MQDLDILQEFLIESAENLSRLDHEMVELERRPQDRELLAGARHEHTPSLRGRSRSPGIAGSVPRRNSTAFRDRL